MISRLAVVVLVAMLYSYAEVEGGKCANPNVVTTSQITLFPSIESSAGQFYFPGNCFTFNLFGGSGTPICFLGGSGGVNTVSFACNCTKGQAVYNLIGSTSTNLTGTPTVEVACNDTKKFCMKGTNGKKYKLKKATNLLSPYVKIYSYISSKGTAQNLAVLNCPTIGASGNSSSTVTFNKKAGFNLKWNCKKQNGATGTMAAPDFSTKKGKKYIKVAAVSCSGCKNLKTCNV